MMKKMKLMIAAAFCMAGQMAMGMDVEINSDDDAECASTQSSPCGMLWFETPEGAAYFRKSVFLRSTPPQKKNDDDARDTGGPRGIAGMRWAAQANAAAQALLTQAMKGAIAAYVDKKHGLDSRRVQLDKLRELELAVMEGCLTCRWNQATLCYELVWLVSR